MLASEGRNRGKCKKSVLAAWLRNINYSDYTDLFYDFDTSKPEILFKITQSLQLNFDSASSIYYLKVAKKNQLPLPFFIDYC